jgi:Helix-turn-helix domain
MPTNIAPLCVAPKVAANMLGYGITRMYQLINSKELESFLDGGARRITTASLNAYIQRKLKADPPVRRVPGRAGPGRPKKTTS